MPVQRHFVHSFESLARLKAAVVSFGAMSPAVALAAVAVLAAGPPKSNQTILTARQSQRLVDYSAAMGACLRRGGLPVSAPRATRTLIALRVTVRTSQRAVNRGLLACGRTVGDPPLDSSLQGFADRVVLYVPRQCLIDEHVARRTG